MMSELMKERLDDGTWWREAFDVARGYGHRQRVRRSVEWFMGEQGLS